MLLPKYRHTQIDISHDWYISLQNTKSFCFAVNYSRRGAYSATVKITYLLIYLTIVLPWGVGFDMLKVAFGVAFACPCYGLTDISDGDDFMEQLNHAYFTENRVQILADWFELLAIPSVGADINALAHCARAAAWLKRWLKQLDFTVEVFAPERGQPILLAERRGETNAPVVLFYGHYDVQPADPLEEWCTPPFEPTLSDERVYARGAQDNKGQLFAFLQGVAARINCGKPLPTIRLLLEGEEESGSPALLAAVHNWRERLAADILLVCDTAIHPCGRPAIVAGLRGVQSLTVKLYGPSHDLHSGTHGGLAANPALGMVQLLATLHNSEGRVAVDGFWDGWVSPSEEELKLAQAVAFNMDSYISETGARPEGGEKGIPHSLRTAFYPTIEVNGIHSGYGGAGSKTIIPASALAKLSARLAPGQNPQQTMAAIVAHLQEHCPPGLRLEVSDVREGAGGFRLSLASPVFRLAADVLTQMDPEGPLFLWEGASIPVISILRDITGAAPLLVGFGRESDRIHAPNESFGLDQFQQVMTYADTMLGALVG